jgi:NAD(P)-dependent dehydrogenase (short-subunit alcohol dehydrogenase family)
MGLMEAQAGLAGKTAVVVGGGSGIGRAVTLALAGAGVAIALCDVDEAATKAIVPEVEALGVRILSAPADVCDADALDRFYDAVEAQFDHADILVNVAGGVKRVMFMETSREANARDMRLNYGYVVDSFRRAVPLLRKSGTGGSIVSFITIEASRGAAGFAVYAGAKAATANFSRAMAVELADEGIRVNLIAPDTTPSRTSQESLDPALRAEFAKLSPATYAELLKMYIPQGAAPAQEDLANAVLFLVSDLSRTITGATLPVDGGTNASMGFLRWPFGDGFGPAPMPATLARLFERGEG